jgi:hypothetical protein
MAASLETLCHYQDEGESFVESNVTGDETWAYEFIPESKRNSIAWKHPHSSSKKRKEKLLHLQKKQWRPCFEIVKASCCANFFHQNQQPTTTNAEKLENLKNISWREASVL